MKIVREVPISEITKAVTELLDEDRNGPNQAFYDYAAEKGVWRNGSMTEDVMRGLLAGLPDCNASTVFAAAANKALDLAAADTVRPFDHVVFGHEIEHGRRRLVRTGRTGRERFAVASSGG